MTKALPLQAARPRLGTQLPSLVKTRKKGCLPPPLESPRMIPLACSLTPHGMGQTDAQPEAGLSPKWWPVLRDVPGGSSPLPIPQLPPASQVSMPPSVHEGGCSLGAPVPRVSALPSLRVPCSCPSEPGLLCASEDGGGVALCSGVPTLSILAPPGKVEI